MITVKLPYTIQDPSLQEDYDSILSETRRIQTSIYHVAYKRASEGLAEIEIRSHCRELFPNVDSWIVQSAVKKGIGQFKADWALAKSQDREFDGKRIFGGKKNFHKRSKDKITEEEWKECRLENLYLIGEAPAGGNRKFIFNLDSITFRPSRGVRFELDLPNLHGKYKEHYDALVVAGGNKSIPVTVSMNGKFIFLSFEETKLPIDKEKPKKPIAGRHLGIDLNPNYIGVSFFDENENLLDSRLYDLKDLTGKVYNPDKLKHEVREISIQIGRMAQHYQLEWMFVEDLHFKQGSKGIGRAFNRLTSNQFLIREFIRMLSKFGKVKEVNAAYSSTIGNIVHSDYPDPIAASMEIARRGIQSRVVKGSKRFYPPLVDHKVLQNRWKKEDVPLFSTWIDLHRWLKETGLKYRVPIPSRDSKSGMFRLFDSSISSKVYVFV